MIQQIMNMKLMVNGLLLKCTQCSKQNSTYLGNAPLSPNKGIWKGITFSSVLCKTCVFSTCSSRTEESSASNEYLLVVVIYIETMIITSRLVIEYHSLPPELEGYTVLKLKGNPFH